MAALLPSRRSVLAAMALAFAGSLAGSAAMAVDATQQPALAFLNAIYDSYRNGGPGVDLSDRAALARYFTPELATLIGDDGDRAAAAGEVPNLSADPFIDAQDGEITDITVTISDAPGGRFAGHVAVTNSGETKKIEIELTETPEGWRIDDIHWPEASLRGLYSH